MLGKNFGCANWSRPSLGYTSSSFDWRLSWCHLSRVLNLIHLRASRLFYPGGLKVRCLPAEPGSGFMTSNWSETPLDPPEPPETKSNHYIRCQGWYWGSTWPFDPADQVNDLLVDHWVMLGKNLGARSCSGPFLGITSSSFDWRLSMDQLSRVFKLSHLRASRLLYPRRLKVSRLPAEPGSDFLTSNRSETRLDPPKAPETKSIPLY